MLGRLGMKKQFHIKAAGRDPIIIDLNGNEGVYIHVDSNPTAFGQDKAPDFRIDVLRWAETEHFHLGWGGGALTLNESFTVTLVESDAPATPLEKQELYIPPEMACNFCRRKRSEVAYLVQASYLAKICDECIARCQRAIDRRKSTLNPDKIISVKKNSPWWRPKATSKSSTPLTLEEPVTDLPVEPATEQPLLREETLTNYGVSRDFFAVSAQGEKKTVSIRIGQPYPCPTGDWACPVALEGLHTRLKDQHGIDAFQALMLAQNLVRILLNDFVEKGGSLRSTHADEPIDLEKLFTTGLYS